jgi:MFS family permease
VPGPDPLLPAADAGAAAPPRAAPRIFYGWVIVAAAFLVLFTTYGTQYCFGVFFPALLAEFGWSRASLSGAFSLYSFSYGAFALLAGRLTDRWGPRAVVALGGVFLGLGLIGMSLTSKVWHPYVAYGCVAALGMSTAFVPCSSTVARWFVRRRGLAVGLAFSGMGLGTLLLPPLAHLAVSRLGWRGAYVAFGVGVLLALNLIALLMRRDPESLGLLPDGDRALHRAGAAPPPEPGWTVASAARTGAFWMIFGIFATSWVFVFGPLVHLVPMATGLGVSPLLAATLLSMLGLAALFGRLFLGGISDGFGRRLTLAVSLALQVVSFAALAVSHSLTGLYVAAFLFGFSYGGVTVMFPALIADFFGREQAGSLVGLLFAIAGSMGAWGPLGAGFIYDRFGSYGLAWWLSAGFNVLALALLAFTHAPPEPAHGRTA